MTAPSNRRILLVARDMAPSGCFERLAALLREQNQTVEALIGKGKPLSQTIEQVQAAAATADLVVLGMSSSAELAEPEIAAGLIAQQRGIPYGFYGDIRDCWGRARPGSWFAPLAEGAVFYAGLDDADAHQAHRVFPRAICRGTGNPLREDMAFPRKTREEVRTGLGLSPDTTMILAPGTKTASTNIATWAVLMEAIGHLMTGNDRQIVLVLSTHPGDLTVEAVDPANGKSLGLYEQLAKLSPCETRVIGKMPFSTSEMVPGADLIVDFSGSTAIEGAFQRIPVICLDLAISRQRLRQENGRSTPECVEDLIAEPVGCDKLALSERMEELLSPTGFAELRKRQTLVCPRPSERGAALKQIAALLAEVTR